MFNLNYSWAVLRLIVLEIVVGIVVQKLNCSGAQSSERHSVIQNLGGPIDFEGPVKPLALLQLSRIEGLCFRLLGGPIEGPLKSLGPSQHSRIMPR